MVQSGNAAKDKDAADPDVFAGSLQGAMSQKLIMLDDFCAHLRPARAERRLMTVKASFSPKKHFSVSN